MNTGNSIAIIGALLLLSACGKTPDTALDAGAPDAADTAPATAADAPNAADTPPAAAADAPNAADGPSGAAATPSTAAVAGDSQPCAGADTQLSDARRKEYPGLVANAMNNKVKPEAVDVDQFMGIGTWSAVSASTPVADPGWFVFERSGDRQQFKDVWGGDADEGDRQALIEWATGLDAPADFAACFAQTLIG